MVEAALPEETQTIRALLEDSKGIFAKDCGELEDIRRELKSYLGYNVKRLAVINALRSVDALPKRLMPRGQAHRSIWIWRNQHRWDAAPYEDVLKHLDELA
jgi:hypothetical protein